MHISPGFRRLGWFLGIACVLVGSNAARAAVIWRADFETGNLDQIPYVDGPRNHVRVVRSPVRDGMYAARIDLAPGDRSNSSALWRRRRS